MKKITNEEFVHKVFSLVGGEYEFLENYQGTHIPILAKHIECGNVYSVAPSNFIRGKRCPKCSLEKTKKSKEEFEKQFYTVANGEYLLLSEYQGSNKKIKVKHLVCGREYDVKATSFINDNKRCYLCSGKMKKSNLDFLKDIKELVDDEYQVLEKYINEQTPIKFMHKTCGTIFMLKPNAFIWGGRRCPKCKTLSHGEKNIEKYLIKNNIEYEKQKIFPKCTYIKPLKYDFYLKKQNTCIEFDGIQHYRLSFDKNEYEFRQQKERDRIKNEYCEVNGINLLRIPYWDIHNTNSILADYIKNIEIQKENENG